MLYEVGRDTAMKRLTPIQKEEAHVRSQFAGIIMGWLTNIHRQQGLCIFDFDKDLGMWLAIKKDLMHDVFIEIIN